VKIECYSGFVEIHERNYLQLNYKLLCACACMCFGFTRTLNQSQGGVRVETCQLSYGSLAQCVICNNIILGFRLCASPYYFAFGQKCEFVYFQKVSFPWQKSLSFLQVFVFCHFFILLGWFFGIGRWMGEV
jgi:hypothetical protein